EFEPHQATIMIYPERPGSWPYGAVKAGAVFERIIKAISQDEKVWIIVSDNTEQKARKAFANCDHVEILNIPTKGCVNVHTSLLPKYRGSSPIQWAIIEGETQTGVTVMQMDAGMDTGDILFTQEIAIDTKETGGSLHDKLADAGAELIVKALDEIEAGNVHPVKQDSSQATYTKMLDKGMGNIRFEAATARIERMVRALNPWPSTYTYLHGKILKIWAADVFPEKSTETPGTVIRVDGSAFYVKTGDGVLKVTEVQLEGKKRMSVKDFLLGAKIQAGDVLG
ncbi:MAG: methionyl-tRNA formyltransferase, partial [Lachnospiraceae bacterium]|nr:methionyl-tRNA formyltransferase [Lachnospiraceae bacterium]